MHLLFKQHIHAEHQFMCVVYEGYVNLEPVAYSKRQRLLRKSFENKCDCW